jgi:hypothetical protein
MPQDAAMNPQLYWNLDGFDSVFYRKSLSSKIVIEVIAPRALLVID